MNRAGRMAASAASSGTGIDRRIITAAGNYHHYYHFFSFPSYKHFVFLFLSFSLRNFSLFSTDDGLFFFVK